MSDISSIPDSEFENLEVAVLSVCYAGKEGHLSKILHDKGVDVVIAFKTEVLAEITMYWINEFHRCISLGYTVESARASADNCTEDKFINNYNGDDELKDDYEQQCNIITSSDNKTIYTPSQNFIPCPSND